MWVTMAGKDEKFVTMSVLHEMLEQQKTFYKDLEQQEKSFKSCLQVFVDSVLARVDNVVRDFKRHSRHKSKSSI